MSWNYRVVRYKDKAGFGLHEVYYDDKGEPWGMTEHPTGFVTDAEDGPEGIAEALEMAREAALKLPVLDIPDKWPGRVPPKEYPH